MSEGGKAPRTGLALVLGLALATTGRAQGNPSPYLDDRDLGRLLFGTNVDSKTLGVFPETKPPPGLARRWLRVPTSPRVDTAGRFVLELRIALPEGVGVGLPGDPVIPLRIELSQSLGLLWSGMELDRVAPLEGVPGPARYGVSGVFRVRVQGQLLGPVPPRVAARVRPVALYDGHVLSYPMGEVSATFGRGRRDPVRPKAGLGRLEVSASPAPGTLVLPGLGRAFIGETWTVEVPPGSHRVLGLKNGNPVVERSFEVGADRVTRDWLKIP